MLGRAPTPWKKARSGIRPPAQLRSGKHLAWLRTQRCLCHSLRDHRCEGPVQAAHVRRNTDAGLSAKPSDCWTVPLCHAAHSLQHQIGEQPFERKFGFLLKRWAEHYAAKSPDQRIRDRVK
jgi:hypothetical protein